MRQFFHRSNLALDCNIQFVQKRLLSTNLITIFFLITINQQQIHPTNIQVLSVQSDAAYVCAM